MDSYKKKEKKFDFIHKKECLIKSLYQVNCFLSYFSEACKVKKIFK